MNVLIACEESQRVCMAFRRRGHQAFSCDVEEPSGGHPEWHIRDDARWLIGPGRGGFETMDGEHYSVDRWDLLIAHPPCTFLTNASAVRMKVKGRIDKKRYLNMIEARAFFLLFFNSDCDRICVENPVPMKLAKLPPYSQIIQPYQFGHPYSKKTCLWLKCLPDLQPTNIITEGIAPWVNGGCKDAYGNYRRMQGRKERDSKNRSKTFEGVADAMANQWG